MRIVDANKVYKGGATVSKIYKGSTLVYPSASSAIVAPNTFTLSAAATTSAGVYSTDGTLVRTLWSGVKKDAGTYPILWDGTDDFQNPITAGSYTVKVLSNNVTYTWEGAVIGNTSSALTGETKYRGNDAFSSMVIVGSKAYVTLGYMEGNSPYVSFNISNPQSKTNLFEGHNTQTALFTATDGVKVYWAVQDSFAEDNYFVFATRATDDSEYIFPSGTSYKVTYGNTYNSVVGLNNAAGAAITGIAVQKNGNYLFVSRKGINQLLVINKTTGAVAQTITISSPRYIAVDGNDNLWLVSATSTVGKYIVSASGTVGSPVISLQGLISPLAVSVSPDGATVLVADGGASQQLKAYGNSTGGLSWTYGQAGGYLNNALVSDDKFFFSDTAGELDKTFVVYQPDGSFWINDTGNYRVRHFSAARVFIEEIMYLPSTYSTNADTTNPNRVFANYLEFAIDYTKPLATNNGSWKLAKSWAGNISANVSGNFAGIFRNVITLSNGRTYARLAGQIIELGLNNKVRETGQILNDREFYPDGTLRRFQTVNNVMTWYSTPITGFDSAGNPIWGTEAIMNTSSPQEPFPGSAFENPIPVTSTGITVSFGAGGTDNYTLGGIKNNKWLWKTAQITHADYQGDFPSYGWFDMGNGNVQYRGSIVKAMDRNIFWGYHGEFWKNSQTNKFNHVYDNGLFVGQFGTTGPESGGVGGAMMAGNAFSPSLVKVGTDYYLYHNDESYHGAVHRWKISGLNTIQEQTIPLTSSFVIQSEAPVLAGIDLMAGLPFDSIFPASVAGWTRNPVSESDTWNIQTSVKTYNKREPTDISIAYSNDVAGAYTVTRDLANATVLSSWELKGNVRFDGNMGNTGTQFMYLEILDNAVKIISRFYTVVDFNSGFMDTIWANNTKIGIAYQYEIHGVNAFQPISFKMSSGTVVVKYGSYSPVTIGVYDSSANVGFPKIFRVFFNYNNDGGPNYGKYIDLSEMRFIAS